MAGGSWWTKGWPEFTLVLAAASMLAACTPPLRPAKSFADGEIQRVMKREQVQGLGVATIENGQVAKVRAFGNRNAAGQPMTADTVVYGAALTNTAFAYLVLQLADEGKLDLDAPLATLLPHPLPYYRERPFDFGDLLDDPRWRTITPRLLLAHAAGLADHRYLEPGDKLRLHFDPGARYAYSSEGYNLLQLVVERGLGLDVDREMQRRVFDRFGMTHTSLHWRADFSENVADDYMFDGTVQVHERRFRVRATGSMDTTIADQAKMWAGIMRGDGLRPDTRAALITGAVPVTASHQFPTLTSADAVWPQKLSAGLGVLTFEDRSGAAWFKDSHDDATASLVICLETGQRCLIMLSNDVRAERLFPELGWQALGATDMPWNWEYSWLDQ